MKYFILLAILLVFPFSYANSPMIPSNFIPVPLVRQATDYSCGAASLTAVLYYWQVFDNGEQTLYKPLKTTPKNGTHPKKIVEVAKNYNLNAHFLEGLKIEDLELALSKGDTVILDLQAWPDEDEEGKPWREIWESGHYVVLVGIDKTFVYFMDPSTAASYAFIPKNELYERWHDYEKTSGGKIWKNYQLGIIISGKTPMTSIPGQLKRME